MGSGTLHDVVQFLGGHTILARDQRAKMIFDDADYGW